MNNGIIYQGVKAVPIISQSYSLSGYKPQEHDPAHELLLNNVIHRDGVVPHANIRAVVHEQDHVQYLARAPEPARMQARMQAPEPARMRVIEPAPQHMMTVEEINARIVEIGKPQATDMFWTIIENIHWRNSTDGVMNERVVTTYLQNLDPVNSYIFKDMYNEFYIMMGELLELDGMFERNKEYADDKPRIISHSIGMGRDIFNTLFEDPAIFQFLIETGECQSLDACIPRNLRI